MEKSFRKAQELGLITFSNNWIERAVEAKNPKLTVYLANSRVYCLDGLDRIIVESPIRQG